MVEIFQTVEGEGTRAGFVTTFVRVYNCNLRCTWCDTPYSYAPAKPEFTATIAEIVQSVHQLGNSHICLTGGEPLMHRQKSATLLMALAALPEVKDVHVETNGAIDLEPFHRLRLANPDLLPKIRFIVDYKLPGSGEMHRMVTTNFSWLLPQDEIKFVVANEEDFACALSVLQEHYREGQVLFSPVWDTMPPAKLVELMLQHNLKEAKLSLQLHKFIWDPHQRGV
ncbi:radical SAM protein [Alicyclobacillus cycloheptanicus]